MTKSPWVKKQRRRVAIRRAASQELEVPEWEEKGRLPGGPARGHVIVEPSSGAPEPIDHRRGSQYYSVFVRWFSSVTVRQAIVRQRQHAGSAPQSRVVKHPEYVIAVWVEGTPYFSVDALTQSAYLQPKRSKQQIPATRVSYAEFGFLFHFPRELNGKPVIGPEEIKVEFHCCKIEKGKEIKVTFDLRKMVRDGNPDL